MTDQPISKEERAGEPVKMCLECGTFFRKGPGNAWTMGKLAEDITDPAPDPSPLAQPDAAEPLRLSDEFLDGVGRALDRQRAAQPDAAEIAREALADHANLPGDQWPWWLDEDGRLSGENGGTGGTWAGDMDLPAAVEKWILTAREREPLLAAALLSAQSSLEAGKAREADLELMLREALKLTSPRGSRLRASGWKHWPWHLEDIGNLKDDGTGLPLLDDAARAALRESRP